MSKKRSFKEIREHAQAVIKRPPTEEQLEDLTKTFETIENDNERIKSYCQFCNKDCYHYFEELDIFCHEDCLGKMIELNQKAFGLLDKDEE